VLNHQHARICSKGTSPNLLVASRQSGHKYGGQAHHSSMPRYGAKAFEVVHPRQYYHGSANGVPLAAEPRHQRGFIRLIVDCVEGDRGEDAQQVQHYLI
jgi:hypothetical protein